MNTVLILMILIAACIGGFLLLYNNEAISQKKKIVTYEELKDYIRTDISKSISTTAYGSGLSLDDVKKYNNQIDNMRQHIKMASSGDRGARKAVQQMIRQRVYANVKEAALESILSFDPEKASPRLKFETLIYTNDSGNSRENMIEMDDGFSNLLEKYEIEEKFTTGQLDEAYALEYMGLEFEDKVNILTQIIFADLYGLGILDSLNYQSVGVEEIQAGMNGPQTRAYDFRQEIMAAKENEPLKCAKDSTELIFKGNKIQIPFLGFNTDAEMQRVIRNLIINSGAGELTEATPKIVADTIDGRRIAASRPPQSDAWIVLIRKFDTIKEIDIRKNYKDKLLTETICHLTKSGAHIAITGEMETGKTTLLRSIIAETDERRTIRIIENDAFELNCRLYFPERNIASLRITPELDEESVLAFVRKTTGHIFSIGEVNSLNMANLCNKLSKIAKQVLFSAHYTSTESLISDFKNAKLCNGFSNERLAEVEAVEGLNIDIHIVNKLGHRYIAYINEVVLTSDSYEVRTILEFDAKTNQYVRKNRPTRNIYEKAQEVMTTEQFEEFKNFFSEFQQAKVESEKDLLLKEIPAWVITEAENA